jgi:hypothetical protein
MARFTIRVVLYDYATAEQYAELERLLAARGVVD